MNAGVGTINVLQLGTTSSGTYVYASPDPAVGRYLLNGSTVIYAINRSRFVLVDNESAHKLGLGPAPTTGFLPVEGATFRMRPQKCRMGFDNP